MRLNAHMVHDVTSMSSCHPNIKTWSINTCISDSTESNTSIREWVDTDLLLAFHLWHHYVNNAWKYPQLMDWGPTMNNAVFLLQSHVFCVC